MSTWNNSPLQADWDSSAGERGAKKAAGRPAAPKYPVYERFYTWQGEGVYLGQAAYFIRLYGCPQACPWCDSAGTWHPDYRPASVALLSAEALAEQTRRQKARDAAKVAGNPPPEPAPVCKPRPKAPSAPDIAPVDSR